MSHHTSDASLIIIGLETGHNIFVDTLKEAIDYITLNMSAIHCLSVNMSNKPDRCVYYKLTASHIRKRDDYDYEDFSWECPSLLCAQGDDIFWYVNPRYILSNDDFIKMCRSF
jgi:hypothetical protein